MGTTWHAHVEIEKNGEVAGYNDTVTTHTHTRTPTAEEVKKKVVDTIIAHSPHLNGGWITRCNIRRIR
jgi:hypothetical protein